MTETDGGWRRTSPVAVVFYVFNFVRRLLTDGLPALAPLAALFATSESLLWSWFGLGLAVLGLLLLGGSVLSWLRFRFRTAGELIEVRRGVIQREQLSIDFNRVQNVSIREPFYMRPFGLATLSIDTAGSGQKEVAIAGVTKTIAIELRQSMLTGLKVDVPPEDAEAVAAPAAVAAVDEQVLLTRSTADVALYGLMASTILWIFVVIGFLFSMAESAVDGWADQLQTQVFAIVMFIRGFGVDEGVAIGLLVIAVLLLLPLLSIAGAIFRHHGYRLTFDGETFRRSSGLLNRHDESLKRHKIQEVIWNQNFMARLLGRINIKLAIAQAGQPGQTTDSGMPKPASAFLVPSLRPVEAGELSGEFLPGIDATDVPWSGIDRRRYVLRGLLFGWSLPVVGASLGPGLALHPAFFLIIPVGLTIGGLIMIQIARRLGYAVVGEHAFLRSGFIGSKTSIFPLYKIQRVDLRQTPSQRRQGLCHLTVHLASGTETVPYMDVAAAEQLRDLALYHAETDPRPWY